MWYSIIMGKQILIIKGSPCRHGNTSAMADAFAQGARESGNTTTEIILMDKMPVLEEVYEAGKRIERNEVKRC